MTGYFYTDPLAAAWMAKYFGVQFHHPDADYDNRFGYTWIVKMLFSYGGYDPEIIDPQLTSRRIHIHPDSLHLLESRVGDVVLSDAGIVARVVADGMLPGSVNSVCVSDLHMFGRAAPPVVIARDGKPFHWPESEL